MALTDPYRDRRTTGVGPLVGPMLAMTIAMIVGLLVPSSAQAQQQGVAIDLGRIDVDEELVPGTGYQLPTVRVRNPGSIASRYQMTVQPIAGELAPDEGWFVFTPARFDLDPDQRQPVDISMQVPHDAEAGAYQALVSAQVAPTGDGARVGAAAATRLTFQIAPTPTPVDPPAAGLRPGSGWLLGLLAAAVLWLVVRLARRYSFRIERRP